MSYEREAAQSEFATTRCWQYFTLYFISPHKLASRPTTGYLDKNFRTQSSSVLLCRSSRSLMSPLHL